MLSDADNKFIIDNFMIAKERYQDGEPEFTTGFSIENLLKAVPIKVWGYRQVWGRGYRWKIESRPNSELYGDDPRNHNEFGRFQNDFTLGRSDNHQMIQVRMQNGEELFVMFHDFVIIISEKAIGDKDHIPEARWTEHHDLKFDPKNHNEFISRYTSTGGLSGHRRVFDLVNGEYCRSNYVFCPAY